MSAETDEILRIFGEMLAAPTGDGKNKRDAGTKAHWTVDTTHKDAMLRHLGRWWNGEKVDADSGAHPLVHLAWRALAVAWQEMDDAGFLSERLTVDYLTPGEVPGQAQFWREVQDRTIRPQGGFISHDPRPLPRYTCATVRDGVN